MSKKKPFRLSVEEKERINGMLASGTSVNAIANTLGRDWKTIRDYANTTKIETYREQSGEMSNYDIGITTVDALFMKIATNALKDAKNAPTNMLEVLRRWSMDVWNRKRLLEGKSTKNIAILAKIQQSGLDLSRKRLSGEVTSNKKAEDVPGNSDTPEETGESSLNADDETPENIEDCDT